MPRDLDDLATSIGRTIPALQEAQKRGIQKAALHVTGKIRDEIRSVTGDMRLSGVGRRGAKVGAKFDIKGSINPTALITATGPLHLIERDTSPHRIPRTRGRKKRIAVIDGHPYHHANHPGTAGKHPFAKGVARGAPDTPKIFQAEVRKAVVKAWGV